MINNPAIALVEVFFAFCVSSQGGIPIPMRRRLGAAAQAMARANNSYRAGNET